MKYQFKYLILITVLALGISSCEITNTVPEDAITDLNYWGKVDDLKLFANSFYTTLSGPSQWYV